MHEKPDINAIKQYSAVILAYIGDAVFELIVREHMIASGLRKIKDIHQETVDRVRARNQARAIRIIYEELSPEEKDIARRGRNAKSAPPKHADLIEYRMSTGFEALIGYLYLKGDKERLLYLTRKVLEENLDNGRGGPKEC
ncbi:MAG: Mini-ribonuclease 3 [Syntrophomonadaceae bacterium]|jgi:ribonuclease-3 family protein|nr:Mini-ribonuclease 3 [Syntrophomonadaceae bacterium]